MANNPIIVKCSSCGSNAEYDIKEHSYCCKACGQETPNADAVTNLANWRKEQQIKIKKELHGLPQSVVSCPNCGAEFFFKEDEATANCPYCNTPMIRQEYDKSISFPESIIPFKITLYEAKKKLQDYLAQSGNKFKEEAKIAKNNINKMQGYYLPYCLIRGPLDFTINRAGTKRQFYCEIYVEKNFINGSKELDNLVLDAMEPYDWKEIVPFDFGYISGQSVKTRNIDEKELSRRAVKEVVVQERQQIEEILDSKTIEILPNAVNILSIPVLLPVYYFKVGGFTVAVNGQTGRVSMTNNHETKKIVNYSGWIAFILFLALELIFFGSVGAFKIMQKDIAFSLHFIIFVFLLGSPLGFIVILMPSNIKIIKEKLPHASEKCLAIRKNNKVLTYRYGKNAIYEEKSKFSFYEKDGSKKISYKINLYKTSTLYKQALCVMFLPPTLFLFSSSCVSLYCFSLSLFIDLIKTFCFSSSFYIIFIGSLYFLGILIYNKIKYIFNLSKKITSFILNSYITIIFSLGIIICLFFSLHFFEDPINCGIFYIISDPAEEAAQKKELEVIQKRIKSTPELKQNNTIFTAPLTKDKIHLLFNEKDRSYFIDFFENGIKTHTLFSKTIKKDNRMYYYLKAGKKKSSETYKVSSYSDFFVITDLNNKERWRVTKYDSTKTLIQKGQSSEEKTLYILKNESKKNVFYLTDAKNNYVGNTRLNKENNLIVFNKEFDESNGKEIYFSANSKPGKYGSKLIGSPAILTIDEFPLNLRCVMMLELSQME